MPTEVQVGQVWRDCDNRETERYFQIERVADGFAYCRRCTKDGLPIKGHQRSRIFLERLKSPNYEKVQPC